MGGCKFRNILRFGHRENSGFETEPMLLAVSEKAGIVTPRDFISEKKLFLVFCQTTLDIKGV
jgi:hypothetical protein